MWVKICGIRDVSTAERVAALSPDAIGLNFYSPSPRFVSRDVAREIASRLPFAISAVGVFVNHSVMEIAETVSACGLTMVQLHGDEPPEFLATLQATLSAPPLIRAWRMGGDLADLEAYFTECRKLGVRLAGCLIDAKVSGSYGGTGRTPSWDMLRDSYRREAWPPLILSGGLTPDNVAEGIHVVGPWGVDVASGVESSPGVKDVDRVAAFIHEARTR
jgi:phosphoribosylanthranilate isomerase